MMEYFWFHNSSRANCVFMPVEVHGFNELAYLRFWPTMHQNATRIQASFLFDELSPRGAEIKYPGKCNYPPAYKHLAEQT
jgi:hypothetical protein